MAGFLLRIIINAVIVVVVVAQLPGIFVDTLGGILLGAVIIGLANAVIRPIFSVASMPLNFATLGGITLIINLVMPVLVTKTLPGFVISSMVASLACILLMTVCSYTLTKVIQDR